jgi:hypothetical protein
MLLKSANLLPVLDGVFNIPENGLKVRYFISQNVDFSVSVVEFSTFCRLFATAPKRPPMDIRLAVKDRGSIFELSEKKELGKEAHTSI